MDDIVLKGMAKWPNVPAVYGWLALDRRGNWLIKGERVGNPIITAFIGRNYTHDDEGRWFFQNGPQRVFVELAYTPLIYRVSPVDPAAPLLALETHTGQTARELRAVYVDEAENFIVDTELGPGAIHDRDVADLPAHLVNSRGESLDDEALIEALQSPVRAGLRLRCFDALIPVDFIHASEIAMRFRFVASPVPPPGVEACY